jgi:pimeloyl-ACP methyl ester carboxylesterase
MNVVLVPRTHCGGWVWKRLVPHLRAAGHAVYTPTLTGLGDRVHLSCGGIDLELHIQDVVNVLRYEDLYQVVLVGWGYGGMVITGVADRDPERVSRLVYLNAFVPRNGQSVEHLSPGAWYDVIREEQVLARGTAAEGFYRSPDQQVYRDLILDAELRAWLTARMTPQPLGTFEQPLRLAGSALRNIPRSYIHCRVGDAGPMAAHVEQIAEWFAAMPGWEYLERPLTHFAPVTMPAETAQALLEVIRPTAAAVNGECVDGTSGSVAPAARTDA